jgi:hypothetical protein
VGTKKGVPEGIKTGKQKTVSVVTLMAPLCFFQNKKFTKKSFFPPRTFSKYPFQSNFAIPTMKEASTQLRPVIKKRLYVF